MSLNASTVNVMSEDLKHIVAQIKVDANNFHTNLDRELAYELYKRHTLQAVLETTSDFARESTLFSTTEITYVTVLSVLLENAPDNWIAIYVQGFNDSITLPLCVGSLRSLVKVGDVKSFTSRDFVFDRTDFEGVPMRAYVVIRVLVTLLKRVDQFRKSNKDIEFWRCNVNICYLTLWIVSQHIEHNLWTDNSTEELSASCLMSLKESFCCISENDLLTLDMKPLLKLEEDVECKLKLTKSVFGKLMLNWKPMLQRNTWQQNPLIVSSFTWCLCRLRFPFVSDYLELVLPPVLLLVDDHMEHNKERGILCLIHIINNVSAEELRWYGRADVIYETLKIQLHSTEESLLRLAQKAISLILKVFVQSASKLGDLTKYDEIFCKLLQTATHENKIVLRRVHTEFFDILIEALGINCVKYMNSFLEVAEEYLEISDAPTEQARLNILNSLKNFIKVAWPRIPDNMTTILKILIKLINQVASKKMNLPQHIHDEFIKKSIECLELLKALDTDRVSICMKAMKELPFSTDCLIILENLM